MIDTPAPILATLFKNDDYLIINTLFYFNKSSVTVNNLLLVNE